MIRLGCSNIRRISLALDWRLRHCHDSGPARWRHHAPAQWPLWRGRWCWRPALARGGLRRRWIDPPSLWRRWRQGLIIIINAIVESIACMRMDRAALASWQLENSLLHELVDANANGRTGIATHAANQGIMSVAGLTKTHMLTFLTAPCECPAAIH